MKLCGKETYERKFPEEGIAVDKQPLFYLKKISLADKSVIDDASFASVENDIKFLGGASQRMKLKYSLVDWKNITDDTGVPLSCTDENKDLLPSGVATWLLLEIDKLNGFVPMKEKERKN